MLIYAWQTGLLRVVLGRKEPWQITFTSLVLLYMVIYLYTTSMVTLKESAGIGY